jgi:hypothetical protein
MFHIRLRIFKYSEVKYISLKKRLKYVNYVSEKL